MNGGNALAEIDEGELLTPDDVAKRLRVHREKVYGWIDNGKGPLEAVDLRGKDSQRPQWKISERALRKFLDERSTQ